MKSPCYLVTLSLESSDFQTFLKQYVILVPFGALILICITIPSNKADDVTNDDVTKHAARNIKSSHIITLKCLSIRTPKTINFPFVSK